MSEHETNLMMYVPTHLWTAAARVASARMREMTATDPTKSDVVRMALQMYVSMDGRLPAGVKPVLTQTSPNLD